MKRALLGILLRLAVVFSVGCGSALTPADSAQLTDYEAQQSACIAASPHDKAAIDACRAAVKKSYCAQWASRFDAGVCP